MPPLSEIVARAGWHAKQTLVRTRAALTVPRLVVRASRAYDAPIGTVLRRFVRLNRGGFILHPAILEELPAMGVLDPQLPHELAVQVVGPARLRRSQLRLSPEPLTPVIDDKALFYTVCGLAGLPVAPVHAFVYRDYPGWTSDGWTPRSRAEWAPALERVLPEEVIAKPVDGDVGVGIRAFRRERGDFWEGKRLVGTSADLYDTLFDNGAFAGFVLQLRVRNHPTIAAISGASTLQGARIITLVDRGRDVSVLAATHRIALVDGVVDNVHAGGSAPTTVDIETGRLGKLMVPRPDGFGQELLERHPHTGQQCEGVVLPYWADALELVRRAALAFAMVRTLGWDIALTPDGPLVMEANAGWASMNRVAPMEAILQRLDESIAREAASAL
jgi:Sugar-transfer associated ATP-grasp